MTTPLAHTRSHRIGRAAAVVVVGSMFGVASTIAIVSAERPARPTPQQQAAESAALAEWARTQHLTGLSPASLTAQDNEAEARLAADLAAIAEFAVAEGLSGLSPASLRPVGD
jgi:hypothetical protein